MKKLFAILLLVCLVFTLCACGNEPVENKKDDASAPQVQEDEIQKTEPQATEPQATEPQATEPEKTGVTYTIKVVDEGNNPVPGVFVQLCSDKCIPKATDENGAAIYENQEERSDYKASVTVFPAGYEAASEQTDFYFENNFEVTIVIKAVA